MPYFIPILECRADRRRPQCRFPRLPNPPDAHRTPATERWLGAVYKHTPKLLIVKNSPTTKSFAHARLVIPASNTRIHRLGELQYIPFGFGLRTNGDGRKRHIPDRLRPFGQTDYDRTAGQAADQTAAAPDEAYGGQQKGCRPDPTVLTLRHVFEPVHGSMVKTCVRFGDGTMPVNTRMRWAETERALIIDWEINYISKMPIISTQPSHANVQRSLNHTRRHICSSDIWPQVDKRSAKSSRPHAFCFN